MRIVKATTKATQVDSPDVVDIESTLLKEFNVDQDPILDEIISNSPKSILNLNCEDIPLDVVDEEIDSRCIPNFQRDMLDHLPFKLDNTPREQNNLYQSGKHFLSSNSNQSIDTNGQKSLDFTLDCADEDSETCYKYWLVDFPTDDLSSGTENYSAGTLDEESISPGDNVPDDDSMIKIDINVNENPKAIKGIKSATQNLDDTNPKICTPIYVPNNLQLKSNYVRKSTEKGALSRKSKLKLKLSKKKKNQRESTEVNQVFSVGQRSLTQFKHIKVRDKPNNCYHLYDFIKDVLSGKVCAHYPRCVEWVHENEKEFRIVNTTDFAMRWGEIKSSKSSKPERRLSTMTYEKVSRTLRYYSGEQLRILEKVEGKKCHFRFGTGSIWSKQKMQQPFKQ